MISIRRIYSSVLASDRDRIAQAKAIFRQHFPQEADYADSIPRLLDTPFKQGYRAVLLVAERALGKVAGLALCFHFPEINSSFLDYLAVSRDIRGGGIGSALYEAVREHLRDLGSHALYLEVMPDDPALVSDPAVLEENKKRLRFYEHYGVRPIIGTQYEMPIGEGPAPHLLFDGLGRDAPLGRSECRAAVQLILRRRYANVATDAYIKEVVQSINDDPVRLRPRQYVRPGHEKDEVVPGRIQRLFALASSTEHKIHHVRERGYVERPARVNALREALEGTTLFSEVRLRDFGERHIRSVHDADFVQYLKAACEKLEPKRPIYPYVFPIRRPNRRPKDLGVRAGYYCIDTFTPLDRNAYRAARAAVNVALTAAEEVLQGRRVAYALCRPPGHHAGRRTFGGFCYFNNTAVAAQHLSREANVAILDIDFHHGNGTQDIFWQRSDVLTLSIHGHPDYAYPYFSGFADEVGEGPGKGFNRNFPLAENSGETEYMVAFEKALDRIHRFRPAFLVVSLGFDTMKGDPTGAFSLGAANLRTLARRLGELGLPTLVVQEGGYSLRNLRKGVKAFFGGLAQVVCK